MRHRWQSVVRLGHGRSRARRRGGVCARRRDDWPHRAARALRQPLLRRAEAQPAVHGRKPVDLCALCEHAGSAGGIDCPSSLRTRIPSLLSSLRTQGPISRVLAQGTSVEASHNNRRRWLWVPAFAGTTLESLYIPKTTKTPERIFIPPRRCNHRKVYAALKPAIALTSRYSSRPYLPHSRPLPDCL